MSTDGRRFVVPDCGEPDRFHAPPGTRPAAYWYEYRDPQTGLAGLCRALCVECCARYRMASQQPGAGHSVPAATRIGVLRDANTQEPVILRMLGLDARRVTKVTRAARGLDGSRAPISGQRSG